MKIMVFFRRDDLYKSTIEVDCPFMLGFFKNGEIVDFKDLGPEH
jgi:hypothetical protein